MQMQTKLKKRAKWGNGRKWLTNCRDCGKFKQRRVHMFAFFVKCARPCMKRRVRFRRCGAEREQFPTPKNILLRR